MIDGLERVVGGDGPEPYIEALEHGAQVVIAGRSSDTFDIYAAVPIIEGIKQRARYGRPPNFWSAAPDASSSALSRCNDGLDPVRMLQHRAANPGMRCTPSAAWPIRCMKTQSVMSWLSGRDALYQGERVLSPKRARGVRIKGCVRSFASNVVRYKTGGRSKSRIPSARSARSAIADLKTDRRLSDKR